MFEIQLRFLQGRVSAARPGDPKRLEWPIEPARLFMAMVAAVHEAPGDEATVEREREVLRWLESLDPPHIVAPPVSERRSAPAKFAEPCTTFVVVNDQFGNKSDPLARGKQPRQFVSGYVGDGVTRYRFDTSLNADTAKILADILAKVVRVGHSSSLVQCVLDDDPEVVEDRDDGSVVHWSTEGSTGVVSGGGSNSIGSSRNMRVPRPGMLGRLDDAYDGPAIEAYDRLALEAAAVPATKASRAAKKKLKTDYPAGPPVHRSVTVGTTAGYRRVRGSDDSSVDGGAVSPDFDPGLIVLTIEDGNSVGLESTLAMTRALRGAVLSETDEGAAAWITGHDADKSSTRDNHLAYVPLAHVADRTGVATRRDKATAADGEATGGRTSRRPRMQRRADIYDGHLMALALALPRGLDDRARSAGLGRLLYSDDGDTKEITLRCGRMGTFILRREERDRPPRTLQLTTWTKPSRVWTSVTPIVLDRFPKADRDRDRVRWNEEVASIVRRSCKHVGLDEDLIEEVRLGTHGMVAGVPSSRPGRGFPRMPRGDGKPPRLQTHAVIQFRRPVRGPLLLGAGRFSGYGFCKPVKVMS